MAKIAEVEKTTNEQLAAAQEEVQDVEDLKTRRARLRREKEAKLKAAQASAEADRAEQMR